MKKLFSKEELLLEDVVHISKILTYLGKGEYEIYSYFNNFREENNLNTSYLKISNFLTYLQINKIKRVYQHLFLIIFRNKKKSLIKKIIKITNDIEKLGLGQNCYSQWSKIFRR